MAGIKQENGGDKIALLKKVELKFHKLAELRVVFEYYQEAELLRREKDRKKDA